MPLGRTVDLWCSAKLSLYASLHNTIASHKSALGERERLLSEARESLVREGGAVVGGGGGAVAAALHAEPTPSDN